MIRRNQAKPDIRDLTLDYLQDFMTSKGEKNFRTKQVYEWLWKKGINSFDAMSNVSKTIREVLSESFTFHKLEVATIKKSKEDKTIKTAFTLHDGLQIESVLIPSQDRVTACISTQVGCPLGCKFCATGSMKYQRNLSVGEIFEQVIFLDKQSNEEHNHGLSNIVIMGMGEPLLNYQHVMTAIHHITAPDELGMSPSRITLSTAGLVDQIKRLGDDKIKFNLAISLHTVNQIKRDHLMPVNKSNPLHKISEAVKYFYDKTGARITYEYLLIKDFNDSISDAKELATFCKIAPCKINLIEMNPVKDSTYLRSTPERTKAFFDFLESKNMVVNLRKSKGADIDAACGQLVKKISI